MSDNKVYILFDNIEDFNNWHTEVNKHFNYPNNSGLTVQYACIITNELNDKVICSFDQDLPNKFLEGKTLLTKDEAIEQGFDSLIIPEEEY